MKQLTKDELKKEAEKWLCNNLHSASEEDFIKAMVEFAEPREKRIAELEQENVELRKDKKELCHSISEGGKACVYLNEQLTKANEIIKDLLGSENTCCEEEMFFEIRQKAENFLKESEVEK